MNLSEVLRGAPLRSPLEPAVAALEVAGIDYDSRRIDRGFVFFAFPGARADGRQFAEDAVRRGAIAVVSELPAPEGFAGPWIELGGAGGASTASRNAGRRALSTAARAFYRDPDLRVAFTGITGTNGKTTTANLADSILRTAGFITAVIGTIEYRVAGQVRPAPNTTPESLDVARIASELADRDGTHLVTEVSSHGLALGRVSGFHFHTAAFTNLTQDHLDFHGTMDAYAAAKRLLFVPEEGPAPKWAILNADDPASAGMAPGTATNTLWYGLTGHPDLRAEAIHTGFDGVRFDLAWQGRRHTVASPMVGDFNVGNILAAAGVGISYGLTLEVIAEGVAACPPVPGRFERVDSGQPFLVVVDYAHTDHALRGAIQSARALTKNRVITVFGCGGDRDRAKRPLMGMAAAELSDLVVLTSDNPRSEDPLRIMNDALVGLGRFDTEHVAEPDRATAIRIALERAQPGDVVLIAGKGHETYQILGHETIHFDDRVTARQVLESLGYRGNSMSERDKVNGASAKGGSRGKK